MLLAATPRHYLAAQYSDAMLQMQSYTINWDLGPWPDLHRLCCSGCMSWLLPCLWSWLCLMSRCSLSFLHVLLAAAVASGAGQVPSLQLLVHKVSCSLVPFSLVAATWNVCAGTNWTDEDALGPRSIYPFRKAKSVSINDITGEHLEAILVSANL